MDCLKSYENKIFYAPCAVHCLPDVTDADHVEAKIAEGVLTLKLAKAESARPKKIQVTAK